MAKNRDRVGIRPLGHYGIFLVHYRESLRFSSFQPIGLNDIGVWRFSSLTGLFGNASRSPTFVLCKASRWQKPGKAESRVLIDETLAPTRPADWGRKDIYSNDGVERI